MLFSKSLWYFFAQVSNTISLSFANANHVSISKRILVLFFYISFLYYYAFRLVKLVMVRYICAYNANVTWPIDSLLSLGLFVFVFFLCFYFLVLFALLTIENKGNGFWWDRFRKCIGWGSIHTFESQASLRSKETLYYKYELW